MEQERNTEQAVYNFLATGPYTFTQVLVVAKLYVRTEKICFSLDDTLSTISHIPVPITTEFMREPQ
jgi:hypothetical protein